VLTEQNIESELSYAYLHAVATRAGFACEYAGRHLDGAGVDATLYEDGRLLAPDSVLQAFALHVQLKATRVPPVEQAGRFSFSLPVGQYDRLSGVRLATPRVLVVLYLPADPQEWLRHSEDSLIAQRCAYWASLRGAPDSPNEATQTVYVPRQQLLSPASLTALMTRCSREEDLPYAA
jgi:hypothetical protein